jgi:cellulose synthase/poly-beta-1,6-N-acetylglucosamine synthase-like glycosyltransferase
MLHTVSSLIMYGLLFVALNFEVFILISYFETIESRKKKWTLPKKLPSVTVMVPVWNEGTTIRQTIESILKLDYPNNLLSIFIINDGSTDDTWQVLEQYRDNLQITLFNKENGGKASALNYGLEFVKSDLVGCLDADSFVFPETLKRIVARFANKETMAVTPSIKIHQPKTIIELIQKVEYSWGILFRNILCSLGAMYVTPGPFSIFRTEMFAKIGGYRHAYLTEDMELALRMQSHHYKIDNAPDAFVLTVAPKTVKALYKQRLRWTYGFMKNAFDYKYMYGNIRYGNLGLIVLPMATFSIFSSLYLVAYTIFGWLQKALLKLGELQTVGFSWNWHPNFDWFYFNTGIITFAGTIGFLGTIMMVIFSMRLAEEKTKNGLDILYFLALYVFLTPLWVTRALFNVAFMRNTSWR